MQVFGAHVAHVFPQHLEQLEAALEQHPVRHVHGADAADVFVHDRFEPLQADRQDIARRYRARGDLVAAVNYVKDMKNGQPQVDEREYRELEETICSERPASYNGRMCVYVPIRRQRWKTRYAGR
jgi:hypothetical protein